ncbi:hypothetical protein ACN47E_010044 [Coniothyrium glycines]
MDPLRNPALRSAKLQTLLPVSSSRNTSCLAEEENCMNTTGMPAPPAYHMVVDSQQPTTNMYTASYTHDESQHTLKDCDSDFECESDIPEITINAATQIRGSGNIVSIAQMDSARIANLIAGLLNGETISPESPTATSSPSSPLPSSPPQPQTPLATTPSLPTCSRITQQPRPPKQNLHITLSCGTTIIGDRNIVGPGLGDIARQVQIARHNHAVQQMQTHTHHHHQQPPQPPLTSSTATPPLATPGILPSPPSPASCLPRQKLASSGVSVDAAHALLGSGYIAGKAGMDTPPMSRSGSAHSNSNSSPSANACISRSGEAFLKRKCSEAEHGDAKKTR